MYVCCKAIWGDVLRNLNYFTNIILLSYYGRVAASLGAGVGVRVGVEVGVGVGMEPRRDWNCSSVRVASLGEYL